MSLLETYDKNKEKHLLNEVTATGATGTFVGRSGNFIDDLFAKHVNAGGRIYLELNWSQHLKRWLPEDVEEYFKEHYDADFDGPSRVTLYHPEKI